MVEGWSKKKILEFNMDFFKGVNAIKSEQGEYVLIPSAAVFPEKIKINKLYKINLFVVNEKQKVLIENDILFNTGGVGTLGRTAFFNLNDRMYFSDAFVLTIRNKDKKVNSKFLFYQLNTGIIKKNIEKYTSGSTGITSIKEKDIKNFEILFPESLKEQQKIADILTKVDETIEATENIIAKDERLKKGLMQDLFSKGIDEKGNLRSEETHEFKDSELGRIPKDWCVENINSVLNLLTDFEANGSFEIVKNNVTIFDFENYAWYVRATDLENKIPLNKVRYVDFNSYKFLKKTSVKGGELLITKRGEIGKVYQVPHINIPMTIAPNMYLLLFNNNVVIDFMYYFFISECGQQKLKKNNASTTLGALYKDDVKNISFKCPKPKEQKQIASILSFIDSKIQKEKQELNKLKSIKEGLMQDLLAGKVRVNHLLEAVA